MVWDFAESNPLSDSSGNHEGGITSIRLALETLQPPTAGLAVQTDAARQLISTGKVVSTDPPYYDNVPYADLSDSSMSGCVAQ